MSAGIVVALEREARIVRAALCTPEAAAPATGPRIRVACCGMGQASAGEAAARLAAGGATLLVSVGFAGALRGGLARGDLVVPQVVRDAAGVEARVCATTAAALCARLTDGAPVHRGALASVVQPASTVERKHALAAALDAVAVDTESAAVAAVARERGLPFVVLRAITDEVDRSLPRSAVACVDATGRVRAGALLRALARHPGDVLALPALGAGARAAGRSLAGALAAVRTLLQEP